MLVAQSICRTSATEIYDSRFPSFIFYSWARKKKKDTVSDVSVSIIYLPSSLLCVLPLFHLHPNSSLQNNSAIGVEKCTLHLQTALIIPHSSSILNYSRCLAAFGSTSQLIAHSAHEITMKNLFGRAKEWLNSGLIG